MIYKDNSMSWEIFYQKISYCRDYLFEKYGFPYFKCANYNPITFYESLHSGSIPESQIWQCGLRYAIEAQSPLLIDLCVSKGTNINLGLWWAVQKHISSMVDYLLSKYQFSVMGIDECLIWANDRDALSLILYKILILKI